MAEVKKQIKVSGSLGQVLNERVEKYERQPLSEGATLKSGNLVEVEMEIDSKNDYEYILFEDMKASGFEPVDCAAATTAMTSTPTWNFTTSGFAFSPPWPAASIRSAIACGPRFRANSGAAHESHRHVRAGIEGQ